MFVFLFELVKDNKCEVWNNYIFLKKCLSMFYVGIVDILEERKYLMLV